MLAAYVSFISAPRRLAAAAGLDTPRRPSPVDSIAPFLGLRHGQTPQARPPAPKLPQPWVDLIHVAPPTAISGGCVGGPVLERAALEVPQLVRYCRSSVALQETGKEWHPAQHKMAGGDVQYGSRGRLIALAMSRSGCDWCSVQAAMNQDIPFAIWDNPG